MSETVVGVHYWVGPRAGGLPACRETLGCSVVASEAAWDRMVAGLQFPGEGDSL